MTEVEQLNERIAQLSELAKSMEATLKAVEEARNRLVVQQKELEPKFERVKEGEIYYIIDFDRYKGYVVNNDTEDDHPLDEASYDNNNYFRTKTRAQEVADKLNYLLKLERLHDIYCPDYVPDWGNCWLSKYYIYQDKSMGNIWICGAVSTESDIVQVYFPTEDIAKKVCDILNAEERSKDV